MKGFCRVRRLLESYLRQTVLGGCTMKKAGDLVILGWLDILFRVTDFAFFWPFLLSWLSRVAFHAISHFCSVWVEPLFFKPRDYFEILRQRFDFDFTLIGFDIRMGDSIMADGTGNPFFLMFAVVNY